MIVDSQGQPLGKALGKPPVPVAGVLGVAVGVGVALPCDDGVAPTDGDGEEVALRGDAAIEGVGLAVGDRLALGVTVGVGDVDRDGCDDSVVVGDTCVPPWDGYGTP